MALRKPGPLDLELAECVKRRTMLLDTLAEAFLDILSIDKRIDVLLDRRNAEPQTMINGG